ncbi:Holliday junction resolvase [Candidatus Woesearchaeota archaeon]|nr:Holliday junction resolvase [Candidatus Woesearchaeota archaeon]
MSLKSKGISAERELIKMFWETGHWAAHRVAGSGSSQYPSPDVIAGNALRKLAVECKSSRDGYVSLEREDVQQLADFARVFGAEAWIALRVRGGQWYFLMLEDLKDTGKHWAISEELAKRKGLVFGELIERD